MKLEARGLGYRAGGRAVLDGVDVTLGPGELVALLGANGAGKTTLLRLLLGLEIPHAGEVRLDGRPLSGYRRRAIGQCLAYVPQSHSPAFPYLVRDVVALGRLPASALGRSVSAEDRRIAEVAMARLQIPHLAERPYTNISGGERQAALIARALAQGARILIMDEPMTGLDFGQQLRLSAILRSLAREGFTVLSTTHDPLRARRTFDRVITLHRGRVDADGPAAMVLTDEAIRALYDLAPAQPLAD